MGTTLRGVGGYLISTYGFLDTSDYCIIRRDSQKIFIDFKRENILQGSTGHDSTRVTLYVLRAFSLFSIVTAFLSFITATIESVAERRIASMSERDAVLRADCLLFHRTRIIITQSRATTSSAFGS